MTQTAPATPCLAKVPLDADRQAYALLIVHADRAIAPQPALRQVVEFESTPHGGFISAAQAHDGGWGYVNEQGLWLVAPTLDNARGFTEDGVARFCRAGRWGYLNLLGQEVIAPQFDDARPMRNGLAAVKIGPHAWRIIDLQGQFTCTATFADLGNFGAVGLAPAQPWDPDRDPVGLCGPPGPVGGGAALCAGAQLQRTGCGSGVGQRQDLGPHQRAGAMGAAALPRTHGCLQQRSAGLLRRRRHG